MKVGADQAKAMGDKSPCADNILRENIVVIAAENHYNTFWTKMMFMAAGIAAAQGGGRVLRSAHRTTVCYADYGYTRFEKLPLEALKNQGIQLVRVASAADVVRAVNTRPETVQGKRTCKYLVQDLVFFSHGLPGVIDLNYDSSPSIPLREGTFNSMQKAAFVADGRVWSFACRTGNGAAAIWNSFKNDEEANPDGSLAQKIANHLGIEVHAFLTRSDYSPVIREYSDSERIATAVREGRVGHEGQVVDIPPEHEALPHPGLANGWFNGARKEGTNEYALWRKHGARTMPVAASTPTGLTRALRVFKPK